MTPSEIAGELNLDEGTVGVYLHEYRTVKRIKRSTTKRKVFNHLALLSEESFSNITYGKLAKILKINKNTASRYLADYRNFVSEGTHADSNSFLELIFRFMDKNPDKRTTVDLIKEFPYIKFERISEYVYRWYRLHPDIRMKKGARGISELGEWTEEELENLRNHQYNIYYKIMKKLGKIPKSREDEPSLNYLERIKEELPYQERRVYNHEKAFIDSCENAIKLLEKIARIHPIIDFNVTRDVIIKLRSKIANLGKDRPTTTIVATAIYLANKKINQKQSSEIMEQFGKCTRESIIHLCNLLKVEKNFVEKTQVSIDFLQMISKEFSTINLEETKDLIREIKKRLKIKKVDRSKEIVVGTAIYLAHKDFTQSETNEIIRKFSKCKPINFSRISNFLQLPKLNKIIFLQK